MIRPIKKIFSLFNDKEKRQIYWLLVLLVLRGLFEVFGVASIMPFIAVAANPDSVFSNSYLSWVYNQGEFQSTRGFLLFLGAGVFGVLILNNFLAALADWKLMRFTWMKGHTLATRLLARYLARPYVYFLNRNSADMGTNVLIEVGHFMKGIMRPFMELVSKILVSVFLFILLFSVDPVLACIVGTVLGSAFSCIFLLVRKKLGKIGKKRAFHHRKQVLYMNEALNGIKDIKVKHCEGFFHSIFSYHSQKVNFYQALHQLVSQLPKYALEVVAFGGVLLITIYFILTQDGVAEAIPLLALYAFAGYRLMPALQGVFVGITTVRFHSGMLDKLLNDLDMANYPAGEIDSWREKTIPLPLQKEIKLENIGFTYPETEKKVLDSIQLKIPAKTTVGIVGTTGAGKTTLIDIILGLLEPGQGKLLVDDLEINNTNKRSWLRNIGYVPQQIFLSDETIRNNIALGVADEDIDDSAVQNSAKMANLHDFITKDLPKGYSTVVGERGIRLSGGQRQRIGIARALYHNPDLVVFDEATSALDNITEKSVLKAINSIQMTKTVIMIAHRLTTLKECHVIHVISDGKIAESGSYDKLAKESSIFRNMADTDRVKS